jgi:hypothetical protein
MSNQQSKKSLKKKVTLSLNNHSVTYNRTRPSNKERQKIRQQLTRDNKLIKEEYAAKREMQQDEPMTNNEENTDQLTNKKILVN